MTLEQLLRISQQRGLVPDHVQLASARAKLRALRRNPGDCEGDEGLLAGLAIAQCVISQGPGYIPVVQRLACDIAAIHDSGVSSDA